MAVLSVLPRHSKVTRFQDGEASGTFFSPADTVITLDKTGRGKTLPLTHRLWLQCSARQVFFYIYKSRTDEIHERAIACRVNTDIYRRQSVIYTNSIYEQRNVLCRSDPCFPCPWDDECAVLGDGRPNHGAHSLGNWCDSAVCSNSVSSSLAKIASGMDRGVTVFCYPEHAVAWFVGIKHERATRKACAIVYVYTKEFRVRCWRVLFFLSRTARRRHLKNDSY